MTQFGYGVVSGSMFVGGANLLFRGLAPQTHDAMSPWLKVLIGMVFLAIYFWAETKRDRQ